MNVLKCLAIDDEPHALELLRAYAEKVPFLSMHGMTTNPWEAVKTLQEESIDLLFLDIQMDEITGLQLLDLIDIKCAIIITSAYESYALEGYQYQVSDYLLKPFSFDRFLKAVTLVRSRWLERQSDRGAISPQVAKEYPEHIFVKGDAKNKYLQIALKDVLYIEGLKNYVRFRCTDEQIVTLQNLKYLEENLPAQFIRVHRSYIINIEKIEKVEGHTVYMSKKSIPVGLSYRNVFYQVLQDRGLW